MDNLFKRLIKKKETPLDRLMKGTFTEEDKEKYLVHYKKDKRRKVRHKLDRPGR